ncbi:MULTISPECIES: SPFH domain-containing protein [Vagococcus]|uniref:Putative virion core protein (Lumpy skin disease virus) n=1 Tax=Vagococcus fluvialis bH819 TaxID=1255619 RepID=A0A1X6WPX9_9ENTE|nr:MULTISPECIES: SPFH domain-containing protein [Vagococcus]SLM86339.1 Putative virion core protein (lumpy skin disease virus) [Vagococcus fluvialis bH819]HCM88992.1 virion core protein [Vagococcus sp.]
MGLIKAAASSIGGGFSDQWLEVIEPADLSDSTVMTIGVLVRKNEKRQGNKKGTSDVITDGSVVHVYPNTMMLLVDGGKIIDYTAEEGYYTVNNQSAPSMFNGDLKNAIAESFDRFKFGGMTPQKQKVIYINLQEIRGIKFGTPSPINYFDNFYNAELFLRTHGTYSVKVVDPILFYSNVLPKNQDHVEINEINDQFLSEFLTALQTSINQMSVAGERISFIPSKSMELSQYMSSVLDEQWQTLRGMEVVSVGVSSISYTDDSKELINMRNKGAMLGDAGIREGFVQGSIAEGMKDAGSNANGSMAGFMGMQAGMGATGNYFSQASQTNQQQMEQQQAAQQTQQAADTWTCPSDQTENTGKFCSECGGSKPVASGGGIQMKCSNCHEVITVSGQMPKFCPECGQPFQGMPL